MSIICSCGEPRQMFCNGRPGCNFATQIKLSMEDEPPEKISVYTRDQIKDAIREELKESDMADRYYEIVGIVIEGLDKIDKKNNNEQ